MSLKNQEYTFRIVNTSNYKNNDSVIEDDKRGKTLRVTPYTYLISTSI